MTTIVIIEGGSVQTLYDQTMESLYHEHYKHPSELVSHGSSCNEGRSTHYSDAKGDYFIDGKQSYGMTSKRKTSDWFEDRSLKRKPFWK